MRKIVADLKSGIFLGAQGEDQAEQVLFPVVRDWKETYGEGAFYLLFLRPGEDEPYLCDIEVVGLDVAWTIHNTDVAIAGVGRAELQYYTGEGLAKSAVYITKSVASIGGAGEPPEPWSAWVENVIAAATRAENAATDAENQRDIAGEAAVEAIEAKEDAAAEKGEAVDAMEAAVAAKEAAIAAMEAAIAAKEAAEIAETAANFFAPGDGTDSIVQRVAGAPERGNVNNGENGPVFGLRNVVDRQEGSTEGPSGIIMAGRENYMGPNASRSASFGHKNKQYAPNTHVSGSENTVSAPYADARGHYTNVEETAECGSTAGFGTRVRNFAEEAVGKYNDDDASNTKRLFSVGNGTGSNNRHSAFEAGGDIGDEYIKVGDERMSVEELNWLLDYLGGQKLEFLSNFNGTCYVSGIGNCTRKNIVVPPISPAGDTVVGIYSQAFQNNTNIETVKLPRTITDLGGLAFAGCSNLQEVYVTTYPNIPTVHENVFPENCHVVVSQENYGNVLDAWGEYGEQICCGVVRVKTAADLIDIAAQCNSGNTFAGQWFVLENDIDLTGMEWRSIGTRNNGDNKRAFRGTFDGQGHTIKLASSTGAQSEGGLIGYAGNGAVIKNVRLTGRIDITADVSAAYFGSLIGCCIGTVSVSNVWSSVNIYQNAHWFKYSGGFIGGIDHNSNAYLSVTDCVYDGTIYSNASIQESGGFIGYTGQVQNGQIKQITLDRCIFGGRWQTDITSGYIEDNGLLFGYCQNNGSNKGTLVVGISNSLITGCMTLSDKAADLDSSTNKCAAVIGWMGKQANNTNYVFNGVWWMPSTFRNGSEFVAYHGTSGYTPATAGAIFKKTETEMAELYFDSSSWVCEPGRYPRQKSLVDMFGY